MKKGGISQPVDPALIAQVSGMAAYGPATVTYGTNNGNMGPAGWFGPLQPLRPLAPPEVAGRQFDYPTGFNLNLTPKAYAPLGFRELRALADNYDLMRLVIETRKDQVVKLKWEIRCRQKQPKGAKPDPRIAKAMAIFEYPDRLHAWDQWVRMLIEDMLVIDAATIYPTRTRGGELYALDLIDGATIAPKIDDWGRIALYQQYLKGMPAVDYGLDELLYLPRNPRTDRVYGYSPVEQVVMSVNIAMRRQLHQLQFYTEGTVPEALIGVPETWTTEQIGQFQQYWDLLLTDNTAERRRARFVPGAVSKSVVMTKDAALKDEYDEWLARIICYAFSVSPQWAVKQMNRATAQSAQEQAQEEGLAPLQIWLKMVMDRILRFVLGWPDLELGWHEAEEQDPLQQANVADKYVRMAAMTVNEVRGNLGLDPVPDGNELLIYTATGAVTLKDALKPPEPPPMAPDPMPSHKDAPPLDEKPPAKSGKLAKADAAEGVGKLDRLRVRMETAWTAFFKAAAPLVAGAIAKRFPDLPPLAKADEDGQDAGDQADDGAAKEAAIDSAVNAAMEEGMPADGIEAASAAILETAATDGVTAGLEDLDAASPAAEAFTAGLGDAGVTKLANPRAVAWADEHAAELVKGIADATRNALRALISQAQDDGWSVAELKEKILADHAFSAERAALIAQHELAAASIQGNLIGWKAKAEKYGLTIHKKTILGLNENHCAVCVENVRAGAIPLDEPYPSGQQASPFHPRCGCGQIPVVIDHPRLARNPPEKGT